MTDPTSNSPHPLLQAALGTLDMTVESEMSLFRQYQTLATLPEVEEEQPSEPHQLPQASSESALADQVSPSSPSLPTVDEEPIAPHMELTDDIAVDLTPSELALFQVDTPTDPHSEAFPNHLEQQEAVLESPAVDPTSPVAGAPLTTEEKENDPHVSRLDPAIEDYLDSSTALRQHLEESAIEPESDPNVGSFNLQKALLLLGLSILGALVVVLLLNVTGLRQKLWPPKRSQPTTSQNNSESPAPSGTTDTSPTPTSSTVATQGPDLSTKEFSDVNLGNLSRLEPKADPIPSSPPSTPSPAEASPTPMPSQESVPIVKNQTSQTQLFYVVLPYNNAASLSQAQNLVPTAFLTTGPNGQQVQVGALKTLEAAQRLAKQLRSQGLSAGIVAPN
ncbi:SPOR domain-containing protein [Acaryochloris sp. IP29b_bin.137]|uniref:SPOR domain-containing protein n=1 Tax=Acaryochloris sp. IP29b_bin.137 TaxID=2969217 RepID=UPI00260BE66A|nr:SPOR domain-containing protein [Acaryochloris sp. IP29b_bin.137]